MKLSKTYEPSAYEPNIYALWETSGAFRPSGEGKPFSIVMPPPNANASLHTGHALDMNLKDIVARHRRMQGDKVIYIPGADHAGFETWVVYERALEKEGKSRFDFTREQLYAQVWDFVERQRGSMELQLRALGVSASWEHLVFTLDEKVITTVYATFKKMWDEGLIYRGKRIVNYCTTHQTSFADIEITYKTEKSKLWKIAYPSTDKITEIVVATTRPETLLGDAAIAVNPSDERYKELIGKHVLLPLTDREIPVVADKAVDPAFGTGAVKVTPAHDPTDFEIGQRHDLPTISVIGNDGTITTEAPRQFVGLPVLEARKRVLAALAAAELMRGEDSYEHSVGHCYKCGSIIQPLLMDQWFIKVAPLTEKAIAALQAGQVEFFPSSKKGELIAYLGQLRDWNISRQIPWGIPIPAFQSTSDPNDWIFDERVDEKTIVVNGTTYNREEDTFDTWFSSGQWPFIVTEYSSGGELSQFFPTTFMEMGRDILRAWAARMMILSVYITGQAPFRQLYLHGMVNDEHNKKMSKSKGNVLDPQGLIDSYGSDALRMGIVAKRAAGQDQAFSSQSVVAGRNFCNKLWNIARYVEDVVGDAHHHRAPTAETIADHWVVRELSTAAVDIEKLLGQYRFAEAVDKMYHTIWSSVADWYIEASKTSKNHALLAWVLETSLKVAHPFAPFVTETIWQTLAWEKGLLINAQWPEPAEFNNIAAAEFEQLQALVTEARYVSAQLASGKQSLLYGADSLIADNIDLVAHLTKLKAVSHTDTPSGLRLAVAGREAWLDVDAHTVKKHKKGLQKRLNDTEKQITQLQNRLANERYTAQAPPELVEQSVAQLTEHKQLTERLKAELEVL